jgi:hypothetical protein
VRADAVGVDPFKPSFGFGVSSPLLVGRDALIEEFSEALR